MRLETVLMANALGYAASAAVLATFLMRTMLSLRLVAILSNVLFLAFGYEQHIYPVLVLHAVLLPINAWRLFALRRSPPPRQLAALGLIGNRGGASEPEVANSRRRP